tara:strand:+ start:5958 stop:6362 length:405 start_codon:yes stop_codon:yes gene_type:complete
MSRNKVIAYSDANGNCRVVIPTMDCSLSDDAVIAKDIPTSDYSIIEPSDLPSNKFRKAWKYDHSLKAVGVNLTAAKDITKEILETAYLETKKENADIQSIADMKGESASLKSNPPVPYTTIDNATSVAELEELV